MMRILVHICCAPCFTSVHESLLAAGHDVVGYFYNPNIHPYQEFLRRLHCLERYTALKPVEVIYDKEYDLDQYLVGALKARYDTPPKEYTEFISSRDKKSGGSDGFTEKIRMRDSLQIKLTPRAGSGADVGEGSNGKGTMVNVDVGVDKTNSTTIDSSIFARKSTDHEFNPRCGYCIRLRLARTASVAAARGFDAFTTTMLESKYQPHEYIRFVGERLGEEAGIKFYYQDFRAGWKESIRLSKELELYRQQYCGCVFSEYERYGGQGGR